jgi:ABC-type lipoprotein release transport system permease subunit
MAADTSPVPTDVHARGMMPRLARIGWSNLWRNPRRTAITAAGLALGIIALAACISLMVGMNRDLIEQGTSLLLGHVEIHARGYRPDRSIFDTIPGDGPQMAAQLRRQPGVLGAAPRVIGYGLISVGEHSAGADLLGLVPALDAQVSTLNRHVVAGMYLRGTPGEVVIGERLARTLAVGPGDQVVLLTQAADGSLGNDLYRVVGLFKTGLDLVDGGLVVMNLDDLQKLLALAPARVHEIAIRGADPAAAPALAQQLARVIGQPGVEVAAWPVLAPEIAGYVAMSNGWLWILYLIVLVLAAIAVLNTMLMAVFERLREFGVLTAIGMRPLQIVGIVLGEVASLAVVSVAAAVAVGTPAIRWLVNSGIDLSRFSGGFTLSGVAFSPVLRGAWATDKFALSAALLIGCALLAGLYPAVRAARVNPAALTRGELR